MGIPPLQINILNDFCPFFAKKKNPPKSIYFKQRIPHIFIFSQNEGVHVDGVICRKGAKCIRPIVVDPIEWQYDTSFGHKQNIKIGYFFTYKCHKTINVHFVVPFNKNYV